MTLNEYQVEAHKTTVYPPDQARIYTVLGLCGEAGELANKVKKGIRGDVVSLMPLIDELGDVLWYLTECARAHGYSLNQIAERNINKLKDRAERGVIKGEGDER